MSDDTVTMTPVKRGEERFVRELGWVFPAKVGAYRRSEVCILETPSYCERRQRRTVKERVRYDAGRNLLSVDSSAYRHALEKAYVVLDFVPC
eukprot:2352388-Prymnesium_polylepis.1